MSRVSGGISGTGGVSASGAVISPDSIGGASPSGTVISPGSIGGVLGMGGEPVSGARTSAGSMGGASASAPPTPPSTPAPNSDAGTSEDMSDKPEDEPLSEYCLGLAVVSDDDSDILLREESSRSGASDVQGASGEPDGVRPPLEPQFVSTFALLGFEGAFITRLTTPASA